MNIWQGIAGILLAVLVLHYVSCNVFAQDEQTLPDSFTLPVRFNVADMATDIYVMTDRRFLMQHDTGYYQFGEALFNVNTGEFACQIGRAMTKKEAMDSLARWEAAESPQAVRDSVKRAFFAQ